MVVSSVQTAPAAPPSAAATPTKGAAHKAIGTDFTTFLKMLTTQMKNQDPLDPMKSADLAVQLATFSGVEQQVRTNDMLSKIRSQLSLQGLGQLAGWVGREASAPMSAYFNGAPIRVIPHPLASADQAFMVVRNAGGAQIQRLPIPVSSAAFNWTGMDANGHSFPPGTYSFNVESRAGGKQVDVKPAEVYARVTEVRSDNGHNMLVFPGNITVAADTVTGIRAPGG